MFNPKAIYYEKEIINYPLGKQLLEQYKETPKIIIDNHNNIEEMRKKQNSEFADMKRNLIIGVRKTHKFVDNHKTSDYLVPYTSSGCTAMCMYCYLVCNYNKCAYLRLFVNREQMLEKIIKTAEKSEKELTFEIGSNSDLVLENTITGNLNLEALNLLGINLTNLKNMSSAEIKESQNKAYEYFEVDALSPTREKELNKAIDYYKLYGKRITSGNGYVDILLLMSVIVTSLSVIAIIIFSFV